MITFEYLNLTSECKDTYTGFSDCETVKADQLCGADDDWFDYGPNGQCRKTCGYCDDSEGDSPDVDFVSDSGKRNYYLHVSEGGG